MIIDQELIALIGALIIIGGKNKTLGAEAPIETIGTIAPMGIEITLDIIAMIVVEVGIETIIIVETIPPMQPINMNVTITEIITIIETKARTHLTKMIVTVPIINTKENITLIDHTIIIIIIQIKDMVEITIIGANLAIKAIIIIMYGQIKMADKTATINKDKTNI